MTRSEYQELVEFLGEKFNDIEARLIRVEVSQEQNRALIETVSEGVANVNERLDRFQEEVSSEFRAVRSEMSAGFTSVWEEFGTVRSEMSAGFTSVWAEFRTVREEMSLGFSKQTKLIERLDSRVSRWEAHLN